MRRAHAGVQFTSHPDRPWEELRAIGQVSGLVETFADLDHILTHDRRCAIDRQQRHVTDRTAESGTGLHPFAVDPQSGTHGLARHAAILVSGAQDRLLHGHRREAIDLLVALFDDVEGGEEVGFRIAGDLALGGRLLLLGQHRTPGLFGPGVGDQRCVTDDPRGEALGLHLRQRYRDDVLRLLRDLRSRLRRLLGLSRGTFGHSCSTCRSGCCSLSGSTHRG